MFFKNLLVIVVLFLCTVCQATPILFVGANFFQSNYLLRLFSTYAFNIVLCNVMLVIKYFTGFLIVLLLIVLLLISDLRRSLTTESPLKMMKNAFHFTFWLCGKTACQESYKVNFKIDDLIDWTASQEVRATGQ